MTEDFTSVDSLDEAEWLHKPVVHETEGGDINYRASGLGGCLSALVYARLEYPTESAPDWLIERMEESADREQEAIDWYVNFEYPSETYTVEHEYQAECNLAIDLEDERINVLGHADDVIKAYELAYGSTEERYQVDHHILEVKILGEALYKKMAKGQDHATHSYGWQISCYIQARELPLVLLIYPKEETFGPPILYFYQEAPVSYQEIVDKVFKVEVQAVTGVPLECDGKAMWPCPYWKHHVKSDEDLAKVISIGTLPQGEEETLGNLVRELAETKEQETQAKGLLASIKKDRQQLELELFQYMEANGDVDTVTATGLSVRKITSHSTYPDWDKMEKDGIDVDTYKRKTFYSYAKVTKVKGAE